MYFAWQGHSEVTATLRITLFAILVGIGSLGIATFAFIKVLPSDDDVETENFSTKEKINLMFKTVAQAIKYCTQEKVKNELFFLIYHRT